MKTESLHRRVRMRASGPQPSGQATIGVGLAALLQKNVKRGATSDAVGRHMLEGHQRQQQIICLPAVNSGAV
eukprot:scaffold319305_cov22-Prasinocladus_malaysianus.AAC.2